MSIINTIRNDEYSNITEFTITRDDMQHYIDGDLDMNEIDPFDTKVQEVLDNKNKNKNWPTYLVIQIA